MAGELGELSVSIGADTSGLKRGVDEASGSLRSIGRRAAAAARGVALVGTAAAAAVAGFTALSRSVSDTAREIKNFAQLANTSTTQFQRLAFGAESAGVPAQKFADILKDVNDKVGDFLATGGGELQDFFEQIAPQVGITAEEFRKLSGPQALQRYFDGLEQANLSQSEMTFFMEAIADEASALIPLLRSGGQGFSEMASEADRLNAVLSQIEIQRLTELRGEFAKLEQQLKTETARAVSQFDDIIKTSLEGISDAVENVARGFNAFMDDLRDAENKRSIEGINRELERLFDQKARLDQRVDMFGVDSPQGQQAIEVLREVKAEYDELIARKQQLMAPVIDIRPDTEGARFERVGGIPSTGEDEAGGIGSQSDVERTRANLQAKLDIIRESLMTERELEIEHHEQRKELLAEIRENELITAQEHMQLLRKEEMRHNEILRKADEKTAQERAEIEQKHAAVVQSMREQVVRHGISLLRQFAGESKAAAIALIALEKGLAIAQTIMQTQVAQMRALAELGPIAGPPVAAKIGTMGAVSVAVIVRPVPA